MATTLLLQREKALVQDLLCSASGSLMLMGEHAVLEKKLALSCAVDKRISVHMHARDDDQIIIKSSLGTYSSSRFELLPDPRFTFVLACLEDASSGLELTIESDFS